MQDISPRQSTSTIQPIPVDRTIKSNSLNESRLSAHVNNAYLTPQPQETANTRRTLGSPPMLTGVAEADQEIMSFYRMRDELLRRSRQ